MLHAQPSYDLVLKGGHVIDPKNGIDGIRDVAIKDHKIAEVAEHIQAGAGAKVVDVAGLYVTPGLVDIHVHVTRAQASATPTQETTVYTPMDLPCAAE